jgi:adenosylcobinamide-phosphate synthase
MAAMAGALGVRLEKPGHHVLNASRGLPAPADIGRAVRIARAATVLAAGAAVLGPPLALKVARRAA